MLNRRDFMSYAGATGLALSLPMPLYAAGLQAGAVEKARAAAGIPALGAMLVSRSGDVWIETSGVRAIGAPAAVTGDDLWHLGSNTKAMTALLYARLVEDGHARWGTPLRELFSDLKVDSSWDAVTAEQLLSHGAGIKDANGTTDAWMSAAWEAKKPQQALRTKLTEQILGKAVGQGGRFDYANSNYIIIGAAIDRMAAMDGAGMDWAEAMQERLFRPIGIAGAGFGAPRGAQPRGHLKKAGAYSPVDAEALLSDNPPAFGPAGTAHMSLRDYSRFLGVFLNEGGGYVTPETFKHLLTPTVTEPIPYAGGWLIIDKSPWTGDRVLQHRGSNSMWQANAFVAPERGYAAVGVTNSGSDEAMKASQEIAIEFLKSAIGG